MSDLIAAGICLLVALFALVLRKAYFSVPIYELKRRAAGGETYAKDIYPAVANTSLRGLLWLVMTVLSAAFLILLNRKVNLLLGIIVGVIWLWLVYSWIPNRKVSSFGHQLAKLSAPFFIWLFSWAHPVIKQFNRISTHYNEKHTELYENDDLRRFLRHQARQKDNRISARQLMRLSKLVTFEEARVSQFYKPWKANLRLVEGDLIGPKLLDEMHRSKQLAFAVSKQKNSHQISGVLNRNDVGLESEGRVSDYMRKNVDSIGHDESIEDALQRFIDTSAPLLVVLDKENEAVGTLNLNDALEALLVLEKDKTEVEEEDDTEQSQPEIEMELA
ncbi:MAG: CBS domain-containing protein [Candidatus Saccharimonadales bacterium]